jgi:hypothetical protein
VDAAKPYFLWDVDIDDAELRRRLHADDPDVRAQWQGWVMAEARWSDVWQYLTVGEIVANWEHIRRHLGRSRQFWEHLLDGWRKLGLLAA